jgi:hypothetical protein
MKRTTIRHHNLIVSAYQCLDGTMAGIKYCLDREEYGGCDESNNFLGARG